MQFIVMESYLQLYFFICRIEDRTLHYSWDIRIK
jgi:hypothetical protein